jgi:hypothetical protein
MINQQIAQPKLARPHQVVQWLGAVQAQDYLGALWAVGLRMPSATEQTIEQALAERTIVRTWPMRGTIHFVAPADVRWMQELLTPRVVQRSKSRREQLGLDAKTLAASAEVIARALEGGRQLPRSTMYELLEQAGIDTGNQRGLHILGQLAHDQLICFGARAGKQPTFALLHEWAPEARSKPRDEALAELAKRYFSGHGPATLQDFMWWSGLTATEGRAGLGAAAGQLGREQIGGQEYYFAQAQPTSPVSPREAFLLPPYDEFLVGYRDRSASLDPRHNALIVPTSNGVFSPIVVVGGRVVGTWRRVLKRDTVEMIFSPFASWDDDQIAAIKDAAEHYGRFVGKIPSVQI